ncbi:MAG: hypothetical protein COZ06_22395 [Armatimonadetes bacterium CG_4_10_14_3_um_filter_66_18]|nr:MAG: hypothetical protein AUJ96_18660 [Armatimonadetes bacterium CG2_30_66_41]PIU94364.1 MAG: hypothetical protein COS65_07970 [Armatimonadetes bacterium CG06_land_8_20_14_3_00_66_21]PIW13519.1 MAG: hypothetical protein COW34_09130 [Armatimonadetes bacterium CG17_big_fil_post_rev_8_21_14_2_50_66_6]PIX43869.1 MAG: hypothetical protein COZ57_18405 [Armatimonadetes bacterium CG_4_8_14_3_um_filter_66_20]PIY43665.1 MAG: hypothetical protein COZ06_22395 [Armatimonadetes bacterium CG_4_10_14_3_um_f
MKASRLAGLAAGIMLVTCAGALWAQVYQYQDEETLQWKGARSAVLLPARNESSVGEAALAVKSTAIMRQAMLHSKKFELVSLHQLNPAVRRAVSDKLLDGSVVDAAAQDPKLESVLPVAAAVGVKFVSEVSVQSYQAATETTPLEVTLSGALYEAATGEERVSTAGTGPVKGRSLSNPLKVDAKRLETEALSDACNRLVKVLSGLPLPAEPPKREPKPEPEVAPAPVPVAAAPAPAPEPTPAPEVAVAEPTKVPLGREVHLPMEWLYYLLSVAGVAAL